MIADFPQKITNTYIQTFETFALKLFLHRRENTESRNYDILSSTDKLHLLNLVNGALILTKVLSKPTIMGFLFIPEKNKILIKILMKKFVAYLFILPLLLLSCGKNSPEAQPEVKKDEKMISPEWRKMNPMTVKGMFLDSAGRKEFFDCSSKKTYKFSMSGEFESIKNAYDKIVSKKGGEKVYLELEGFVSTESNPESSAMDTVFVVTRFFKLDRARVCE